MRFSSVDLPALGRPTKERKRGVPFPQQAFKIQPAREHRQLTVSGARPLIRRPIPVQLHAVVVGIAKVERLADAMVGSAVEANPRLQHAAQRIGQLRAGRVEDRRVVQPGRAGGRRRAAKTFPGVQSDVVMVAAGREKRCARTVALRQLESEHVTIEPQRAIEIGHLQVHVANTDACMDRRHGYSASMGTRRRTRTFVMRRRSTSSTSTARSSTSKVSPT
jgi:hypothetical protein